MRARFVAVVISAAVLATGLEADVVLARRKAIYATEVSASQFVTGTPGPVRGSIRVSTSAPNKCLAGRGLIITDSRGFVLTTAKTEDDGTFSVPVTGPAAKVEVLDRRIRRRNAICLGDEAQVTPVAA